MIEPHTERVSSVRDTATILQHSLPPIITPRLSPPSLLPVERRAKAALLIEDTDPQCLDLSSKKALLGIGFGKEGIPVDVLTLLLAGASSREFEILLVDEFARLNGMPESEVIRCAEKTRHAVNAACALCKIPHTISLASEIMANPEYHAAEKEIRKALRVHNDQEQLQKLLLETLPPNKRAHANLEYSIKEIAITAFLAATHGIEVKLGPPREQLYDRVMKLIEMQISFAYSRQAFATGTAAREPVVHYIPSHRGRSQGTRIFLEDNLEGVKKKLEGSSIPALDGLGRLLRVFEELSGSAAVSPSSPLHERLYENLIVPMRCKMEESILNLEGGAL